MKTHFQQFIKNSLIITCMLVVSSSAMAERGGDGEKKKRKGPPPQAIEACSALNEGDGCQFSGRRGEVSGICFLPPKDDSVLACKPQHRNQKD